MWGLKNRILPVKRHEKFSLNILGRVPERRYKLILDAKAKKIY